MGSFDVVKCSDRPSGKRVKSGGCKLNDEIRCRSGRLIVGNNHDGDLRSMSGHCFSDNRVTRSALAR